MAKKKPTSSAAWRHLRFDGQTFALAGVFSYPMDRKNVQATIEAEGGEVVKTVTADVNYVLAGASKSGGPSTAEKKAATLNQNKGASIAVIGVDQLTALLMPDRDEALDMLRAGEKGCERFTSLLQSCSPHRFYRQNVSLLDLSNAELRGVELKDIDLTGVCLDGADFRKAKLSNVRLDAVSSARFEGAVLELAPCYGGADFEECRFAKATLKSIGEWGVGFTKCDFSGAKFDGAGRSRYGSIGLTASECSLKRADLAEKSLSGSVFSDSDLTGANFRGATLRRSSFNNATLTRVRFVSADLAGADFTGATVDGADFRDALINGAIFTDVDPSKAKHLDLTAAAPAGKLGPNLIELANAASASNSLSTSLTVDRAGAMVTLQVSASSYFTNWGVDGENEYLGNRHQSLSDAMLEVATLYHGEPDFDSLTTRASKCSVKGKALKQLALAAWCEALGVAEPSEDQLAEVASKKKSGQAAKRAELVELLKSGPDGVKQWNEMDPSKTSSGGKFRNQDFSKANLEGWDAYGVEFEGCDFSKAKLKGAKLSGRFSKCSFAGADLRNAALDCCRLGDSSFQKAKLGGARLQSAFLRRADLSGATLKGADLGGADLQGANLTGVNLASIKLDDATYDDKTVLPDGFVHREEMQWKGAGHPPGLAEAIKAARPDGPIDIATFMERVRERVDAGRLAKALKMLKADRFQLFADVQDDHLVGVVKSQSDADLVYSARLAGDGKYACCTQNLNICGGLRGAPCKHLLVLIIGLAQSDRIDPTTVDEWLDASRLNAKPDLDKDAMSDTLLRYKGAEAGEVDWRPTETVPEDYYAF